MPATPPTAPIAELVESRLDVLADAAAGELDPAARGRLLPLLLASDYAFEWLKRHPQALDAVLSGSAVAPPACAGDLADALRRYRHAAGLSIALRDVEGSDSLEETLAATSRLADRCIEIALVAAEAQVAERHGRLRDAAGAPQRLVVFALGKLGGAELNFSSDVDLVFAFAEAGSSDGERPLDADAWCTRVGQRLIQLLSEVTGEGFVYRVDMRLRPFGSAGRLALSFGAMEQYFQREGRDWERYAWVKARPVAGDLEAGEAFLETLRPFIYRRYLDYTAFEGLREMKAMIAADVQRRDLAEHLKLGPGGIREIEFVAQLLQLIRGGREPALRERGLLPALAALTAASHLPDSATMRLAQAYRVLRRLENRLQLLREEQTHTPPEDAQARDRIALALGHADWAALAAVLAAHRRAVAIEFERVFDAPRTRPDGLAAFVAYWEQIESAGAAAQLEAAGMPQAGAVHARLLAFARSASLTGLSARARQRLDRVLPPLLAAAADCATAEQAVERALKLLHAILRRSSYLSLLAEQPAALARVLDVMAGSALLAQRLIDHPLLLDDLLDQRSGEPPASALAITEALVNALQPVEDAADTGALLTALNEYRQSQAFRIGLACLFRRQPAPDSARQLAMVAEAIVARLLPQALSELARGHGRLPGADPQGSLVVVGYGSVGGLELGFGSDLDLVFLYDEALVGSCSDGERPLEAAQYYARLMQRLVNLLGTLTPGGRLYEVDLRLRPDGAKGLLVSTLQAYADYQRERAWTWEHQALVRARVITGSHALAARFAQARASVLARPRDATQVGTDVSAMRARMRAEHDRTHAGALDLKQGRGGLVDLEFLVQALVLQHAARHPGLADHTATPDLLQALAAAGLLPAWQATALCEAHAVLLQRALACMLDGRPRLAFPDAELEQARASVETALAGQGLA